jgi:5-methyltetrahydropteroyltriglutamate--homocysteine methyltransferase
MEMTKWFNTNYHYIVPELSLDDSYKLNAKKIIDEYQEAKKIGLKTKINIIGPLTFLALSKRVDRGDVFEIHSKILPVYEELVLELSKLDDEVIIEFDEPLFVKDLEVKVLSLIKPSYDRLSSVAKNVKIAVVSYFENSYEATKILINTPIWAIGLDFLYGTQNLKSLTTIADSDKILIAGVVDGRNIWKNDIVSSLDLLDTIATTVKKENILISSSCSLLHVPFSLKYEQKMNPQIKSWLSYAVEKLDEISLISKIFFDGVESLNDRESTLFNQNIKSNASRKTSPLIHNENVKTRVKNITKTARDGEYAYRISIQKEILKYGELPTTTIGSFPQTPKIREIRKSFKNSQIFLSL